VVALTAGEKPSSGLKPRRELRRARRASDRANTMLVVEPTANIEDGSDDHRRAGERLQSNLGVGFAKFT
jgi:hypothetical protein